MISDALNEAIADIDFYLHDKHFSTYYNGQVRSDLQKVVQDMMSILETLDTPPNKVIE